MRYPYQSSCCCSNSEEYHSYSDYQNAFRINEHTVFTPFTPVVGSDSASYELFDVYIASLPSKNCHMVQKERSKRFERVLKGEDTSSDYFTVKATEVPTIVKHSKRALSMFPFCCYA